MSKPTTLEEALEEIRWLRRELGLDQRRSLVGTICHTFKMPPSAARVVAILYERRGRPTTSRGLMEALWGETGEYPESQNGLSVHVWKARTRIGKDAIANIMGVGYQLTEEGISKVEAAIKMAEKPRDTIIIRHGVLVSQGRAA